MSLPARAQVLVVGGGPAGALAALRLAREGQDVLLLEQRRDFAAKVCGEFVSGEGVAVLSRLDLLQDLLGCGAARIRQARLHALSGAAFDASLPDCEAQCGLGVSRALLDETLVQRARSAGARILLGARLSGLAPAPRGWHARFLLDGAEREVRAEVVLGADGRNSAVARHAGLHGPGSSVGIGLQIHLPRETVADERVELFFLREGYAGLCPVESSRYCLGALLPARASGRDPFGRLLEALPEHPLWSDRRACARRVVQRAAAYPVSMGIRRATRPGLFLAGDAAGFVDPFSGQGIALALLGGEAAARAIQGEFSQHPQSSRREYDRFLRRELLARLAVMTSLRRLLALPGCSDRVIRLFRRHPAFGKQVVDLTRIAGSPLLRSLPRLAGRLWVP